MIELRFHSELYDGFAIDEAAKVYAPFATCELVREGEGYVVRVSALPDAGIDAVDERTIAAELSSYALGLTVERQTTDLADAPPPEGEPRQPPQLRGAES